MLTSLMDLLKLGSARCFGLVLSLVMPRAEAISADSDVVKPSLAICSVLPSEARIGQLT